MLLILFFVGLLASCVGTICGIGGGVLIKPTLDFIGFSDVDTVSFLSGIAVLFMAAYTVISSLISKESFDFSIAAPLAIGSAIGGIIGKRIFQIIMLKTASETTVGIIQSVLLIIACIITIILTIRPPNNKKIESKTITFLVGLILGMMSSFLGIGGGPFNLLALSFFFSLNTKDAAIYSLFIILISQLFSFLSTYFHNEVPNHEFIWVLVLAGSGVLGGIIGRSIKKKLDLKQINILIIVVLVFIIMLSILNIIKFIGN